MNGARETQDKSGNGKERGNGNRLGTAAIHLLPAGPWGTLVSRLVSRSWLTILFQLAKMAGLLRVLLLASLGSNIIGVARILRRGVLPPRVITA